MSMTLQQAKARALELATKMQTQGNDSLTAEEMTELTECNAAMAQALNPEGTMSQQRRRLDDKLGKASGFFRRPAVLIAGQVLGVLAIAGLSAFGGMKYEQRRSRRQSEAKLDLSMELAPTSLTVTPAGQGETNVVAIPTTSRRSAAA